MKVPLRFADINRWLEKIALAVNENSDGRTDNFGTVTLTENVTTTTVTDFRTGDSSGIYFTPTTANAAGETPYVSSQVAGTSFTITHANAATTDRTFNYIIVG